MALSVGIFAFQQVDLLDFAGPYEVFTTASRLFGRFDAPSPKPFSVFTVAKSRDSITTRAGLVIQPDYKFLGHPAVDLLLIPGGDVSAALKDPVILGWIDGLAPSVQLVASVGTGSFLLARVGLLHGKQAATHGEDVADMKARFPSVAIIAGQRWLDAGKVVTSAGVSAGIDMSLHLVERFAGRDLAVRTARQMEYQWQENA